MNSLDPRVTRLPAVIGSTPGPKPPLDQFGTFEVFVQPKEGKPFQHEGIVHAPDLEMAYVLSKEAFTRRFTCVSLYVAETRNVYASPMMEGDANAYQAIAIKDGYTGEPERYEIFHLARRGKQHVHATSQEGRSPEEALAKSKPAFESLRGICNIWAIRTKDIRFTLPEEMDLWNTLPEKKFRDAAAYKGGDKLKVFVETGHKIQK